MLGQARICAIGVAAAAGMVAAGMAHAGAPDERHGVSLGVYGAWLEVDEIDQDLMGVGLDLEYQARTFLMEARGELYEARSADLDLGRGEFGIGMLRPWTDRLAVVTMLGGRYVDHDWEAAWGDDRTDVSVQIGGRGWSSPGPFHDIQLRTDLRAMLLYPTDSDADPQAGGLVDISAGPAEEGFTLFARGRILSEEQSAAVGLRLNF